MRHIKILLSIATLFLFSYTAKAQTSINKKPTKKMIHHPKLVIGLVVDQMRWDYLYKYKDLYGEKGFNRLLNEGFSCENTIIKHLPTYTAVGHTGIFSGSVPAIHGIVGNYWIDKKSNKLIYCVGDSTVSGVGSNNENGKMSPRNLWVDEIGDELRLSNNFHSKAIGIALKDRSAILSAGQSANAAYWFDDKTGKWISSSYYMSQLPKWVEKFNQEKQPDNFKQQIWNTIFPLGKYVMSSQDKVDFETNFPGEKTNQFPYHLNSDTVNKYEAFRTSPFGNTFTFNFAKAAIESEGLGKGAYTDLLTLSLSSTDYIGHTFGPNSVEIEDTYIRLDQDISSFIDYLDAKFGRDNYVLMLTSDHGVAHQSDYLEEHHLNGSHFSTKELTKELNEFIESNYSIKNGVLRIENLQVYLSDTITNNPLYENIVKDVLNKILTYNYISTAFELKKISATTLPEHLKNITSNSFCEKRSGDIQLVPKAANYSAGKTISTHGLWNPYDSHIPLIFMGSNIKPGKLYREVQMTDIAPTLSSFLNIQMPNGNVGKVITDLF